MFLKRTPTFLIVGIVTTIISIFQVCPCFAQGEICIPIAQGVPYSSGAPRWWVSPPPTTLGTGAGLYDRLDDPRWQGAASISFGAGTLEQSSFRMLYFPDSLILSWWIKSEAGNSSEENHLFLGLTNDGTGAFVPKMVVILNVDYTSGIPLKNESITIPSTATVCTLNNSTYCPENLPQQPTWITKTHVWIDNPARTWGVNMVLPCNENLINGVNIDTQSPAQFYLWFEILQKFPGSTPTVEDSWPESLKLTSTASCDYVLPFPGDWGKFRVSPVVQNCLRGISISPLDIGTKSPLGSNLISKTGPNTFYAKPINNSADAIDSMAIYATFRLANWGNQPAQPPPPLDIWTTIPELDSAHYKKPGPVGGGGQWNIDTTVILSSAFASMFDGQNKSLHQCMLVELFGTSNTIFFEKNSTFRNMDFEPASDFEETAQINVNGLPPLPDNAKKRDIYLYVQTKNMPAPADTIINGTAFNQHNLDQKLDSLRQSHLLANKQTYYKKTATELYELEKLLDSLRQSPERTAAEIQYNAILEKAIDLEQPLIDNIARTEPAYIVHGYFDTGRKLTIDGVERTLLGRMTSFGYFMMHEGGLKGWEHSLSSANPTFQEIGPNLYKITVDSVATLNVHIAAVVGPWCPWWIWILLLLIVLIIFWIIRRR